MLNCRVSFDCVYRSVDPFGRSCVDHGRFGDNVHHEVPGLLHLRCVWNCGRKSYNYDCACNVRAMVRSSYV